MKNLRDSFDIFTKAVALAVAKFLNEIAWKLISWASRKVVVGIAGEELKSGGLVYQGEDGKYYNSK